MNMWLQKLSVINFKNYSDAELVFSDTVNAFTGNNGAGKTNILDASHYLSLCKSYFNPIDSQQIRQGEDLFMIQGTFEKDQNDEVIFCGLKRTQKKKFKRNKKEYLRLADHIGIFPLVMISPNDISLIIEGSEERRKFIDNVISQTDSQYLDELISYNKSLMNRNALLRQIGVSGKYDPALMDIYDDQLILSGNKIFEKRKAFMIEFTEIFKSTDGMIFFGGPDIPPATYGEKAFITCDIYSNERTWELSFIHHLIGGIQNEKTTPLLNQRPDYLIFGICLGMQEMNVASGGTMYQDIPFQIYDKKSFEEILEMPIEQQHKNYLEKLDSKYKDKTYGTFHSIVIPTKSFLSFDSTIIHPNIACIHHQCIKLLGEHFIVSATSSDTKIIEAIENVKFKNVYGVQFHPEISNLFDEDFKYPISKNDTYQLDETSRKFHHLIWKDFSNRLRLQTYNSN